MTESKDKHKIVLLLTGCIDPSLIHNRWHTLNDAKLRLQQYIEAISFYINNTNLNIVIVENSGYDMASESGFDNIRNSGRIELLSYLASEQVRFNGKGYGEGDILRYALENSRTLEDADYVVKATGRIKIRNIDNLIRLTKRLSKKSTRYFIGEKLYKAKWIQSYLFIAHKDFFGKMFFNQMKLVSERNEDMKMFEEGLYCAVVEWVTKSQGKFYNVLTPIDVEGM